jgi:hypothetical protein
VTGRILAVSIVISALIAGFGLYYLQVYAFYDRVTLAEMPMTNADGTVAPVPVADFDGIDSGSSPIRFRGCFRIADGAADDFAPYPRPEPLIAPHWFSCFDAAAIGADLQSGAARAVLAQTEIRDGVDRIVALYPDGRAFAWHQLNDRYRD